MPCSAFLYKYTSATVRQAAQNIFAKYNVVMTRSGSREYFNFPGDSLGLVLMNKSRVTFWVEDLGDEKSVLYLSAFKNNTWEFIPALKYAVITQKVKEELNAVEVECVDLSNQLFLSEQYLKVFKLTDELQTLYDDLHRLELYTPNATTQINQIKSSIQTKKTMLSQETDILNRFKNTMDL